MSSDECEDPIWMAYEEDMRRRVGERLAEIIELDPEDRLGLVADNLTIRPIHRD